jgi:hypothetical protein
LPSIIREVLFASHGAVKEPGPVEPGGQSCGGSAAVDAAGGALADGAGAEADGVVLATAEADPDVEEPEDVSSLEQATRAQDESTTRIGSVLGIPRC